MSALKCITIRENYQHVLDQVDRSASLSGHDPGGIKIVVVTKGHAVEAIQEAIEAGVRIFGENYAEEGLAKMQACSGSANLEWHMIGHIQSRKARLVSEYFAMAHSLDSLKLARRLDLFARQAGRKLPVLFECNVSGEESKFGWPAWQEECWCDLIDDVTPITELTNLEVRGLMTIAPFLPDPEQTRPYFQRLRRLQEYFMTHLSAANWRDLSMGMSADFRIAVEEGATIVRIGTAIMGPRPE
jgi:pyridoxal phosphate enzyme (YggS family)